jgi:hypothetical protein
MGDDTSRKGEVAGKGSRRVNMNLYLYVNSKMVSVETILGMRGKGEQGTGN